MGPQTVSPVQAAPPADGAKKLGSSGWGGVTLGTMAMLGLGAMIVLPLAEAVSRAMGGGLTTADWVKFLTLWVGLFGAFLASMQDRHLSLALGKALRSATKGSRSEEIARSGALAVLLCLTFASAHWVLQIPDWEVIEGVLPMKFGMLPLPLSFAAMAVATLRHMGKGWKRGVVYSLLALALAPVLMVIPFPHAAIPPAIGLVAIVILAAMGMPLFAALGGASLVLFFLAGGPLTSVPDGVRRITSENLLPSIPLFALAGIVLARGGGPERLIRLVTAWTAWIPGGASVATIMACAFFTAITGASGVTILALGGLLLPVLLAARHHERFSLGLLTASGSVGLLFPPSIPIILYGIKGQVFWGSLFTAAFLPGILLLILLGGFSVFQVRGQWSNRPPFDLREAATATRLAWGDLLLPFLIVIPFCAGFLQLVDTAALAALWVLVLEVGIHRTVGLRRGLPGIFVETCFLVGALMAVIALAFGLFEYLNWALVPFKVSGWVTGVIHSKWVFLLVLNVLLLIVGALMDIFSAIIVVVPVIVPLALHFGVGLEHLGIIFLANLELGYLTPPVGMNLFLSSLTFDRPLLRVWRASLPFMAILAGWVLLVTYVPWLSEGFGEILMGWITGG